MIISLTVFQAASIHATIATTSFVCLIVMAALILFEYMFLASRKESFSICKFLVVTNLATLAALTAYVYFVRSLSIPFNKFAGQFFMIVWGAVPLILAGIEFFIYRKKFKKLRQLKLLTLLLLINISSYFIFSHWFYSFQIYIRCGRRSFRSACASNLKQIGLSLKQYAMDFNDYFPDKDGVEGFKQLRACDYLTNNKVYLCPKCNSPKGQGMKLSKENCDYIYRGGLKDTRIDAGKIPLAWDKPGNHKDYGNVLFIDGHVKGYSGPDWMVDAGIREKTQACGPPISVESRVSILPYDPNDSFAAFWERNVLRRIKKADFRKIAFKKSFKKWKKFQDQYISFSYPDHPAIKLKIIKNTKYKNNPLLKNYSLDVGSDRYMMLYLYKKEKFDDNLCLCGRVAFKRCLFVGGTLMRFNLLSNGYVKQVQALSEKYLVEVERWTHLKMQQAVYTEIAKSIRFREPGNLQKLKSKISAQYKGLCFLHRGMNREQVQKLLGKPTEKKWSALIYNYPEERIMKSYTIEFADNGKFEGFKKGWYKEYLIKPKYGTIEWVKEKAGILSSSNSPEKYYKSKYKYIIVNYQLSPLSQEDADKIFDIFIKKLPTASKDEIYWLCDAVYELTNEGYINKKILPVLFKMCSKHVMPFFVVNILEEYKPKNMNQLLIEQIKLLYAHCRKPNSYNSHPVLFSRAIEALLFDAPDKAHELLLLGVNHPKSELRSTVYGFWEKIPDKKVLPYIKKGLQDPNSCVRAECVRAIMEKFGKKEDLKLLKSLLAKENDKDLKEALIQAIKAIKAGKKVRMYPFGEVEILDE